jgi:hypothetical protein
VDQESRCVGLSGESDTGTSLLAQKPPADLVGGRAEHKPDGISTTQRVGKIESHGTMVASRQA